VAVENIGRVSVICSDKTGTITEGRLRIAQIVPANGHDTAAALAIAHHGARETAMMPRLTAIDPHANNFTRSGITRCARHATRRGPNRGCSRSQVSSRLLLIENAHSAPIKNTVVGITGKNAPITPSATKLQPRAR